MRARHLDNCTENDLKERPVASVETRERIQLVSGSSDEKSSYEEHREDALAPYADEGRGKLRKAASSRKQAMIRGCPNGETRRG